MNLIKSITALFLVVLGQGNILMQNYALFKDVEFEYHKKYKIANYDKQKVASFKDYKKPSLVSVGEIDEFLVVDNLLVLKESQNDRFDFNKTEAAWFACCGHA